MCLSLASLGMSSIIKEDPRVMEIWIDGHPEKYRLDAKNKKLKEEFAAELKKGILKAKENPSSSRTARQPQAVQVDKKSLIVFKIYKRYYRNRKYLISIVFSTFNRMKTLLPTLILSRGRTKDQVSPGPSL